MISFRVNTKRDSKRTSFFPWDLWQPFSPSTKSPHKSFFPTKKLSFSDQSPFCFFFSDQKSFLFFFPTKSPFFLQSPHNFMMRHVPLLLKVLGFEHVRWTASAKGSSVQERHSYVWRSYTTFLKITVSTLLSNLNLSYCNPLEDPFFCHV